MPSATERLNAVLIELPKYRSQWQLNVASPYVRAYDLAVENYAREKKSQAERDRALAEFFVFGASILTGSVMMAAFASNSVHVLAGRAMLNIICNNNLNRTFDLLHAKSKNKTLVFALGGMLDQAKKLADEHVKKASESLFSNAPMASAPTSVNYLTRIDDFINSSHVCTHAFLQGVRDDKSISEKEKNQLADLATWIPFCNPPSGRRVDEQILSQKMELLFYMTAVLDSDRLVVYAPAMGGTTSGSGRATEFSRKSIAAMPSDSNYLKEANPRFTGRPLQPYEPGQRIEFDNLGCGIRDRINMLSALTGQGQFYPSQGFPEKYLADPTGMSQLAKAEQVITRLATDARPKSLTDIRMI
ncbi:hypothetical protein MUU53_20350 [Rhizobium lemnae]|uniref:Uncharacterized protein n=1 Tax=Rhizobium lemnae TaxID=1214924 RepID=A0ABV8ECA2_9HYPH|nr:hypothetical protein [Rhizobium lemnae]MCJ8510241.1 hypothetical protein [Rhizobium lemnae]